MSKSKVQMSPRFLRFGFFAAAVLGLLTVFVFAQAQESFTVPQSTEAGLAASGVEFPVAELGNCGSKEACRAYCDEPGNMPACIDFAKAHGLMNRDDAARAEK